MGFSNVARRAVGLGSLGVGVLVAGTGCTSPNTYASARTLSPGDVSHTLAVEGIAYSGSQGTGVLPVFPTYVFRVGVIDRVDVGARVGNLTELGADIKVNFLRGQFDLAIAGGAEAFIEWHYQPHGDNPPRRTGSRAYFHFPLIGAYNVSKTLSIVGTPGIAYILGNKVSSDFVRTQPFDGGTVAARLGLGIDFRPNPRRAIHPEVTLLQSLSDAQTIVMLGLGFNFGTLPSYDDIDPEPKAPVRTEPPPPAPTTTPPPPTTPPTPPPPEPPTPTPTSPPPDPANPIL